MSGQSSLREPDFDLSTCDREPTHTPGSIQPHGTLIVLREPGPVIVGAAANVDALLGPDVHELIGRGLDAVFDSETTESLRQGQTNRSLQDSPLYLRSVTLRVDGEDRS